MIGMATANVRPLRRPSESHAAYDRRWKVIWKAELEIGDERLPCTLTDISVTGARINIVQSLTEPDCVSLVLKDCQPISAHIVWHRVGGAGLCFLERQAWILRLLTMSPKG